jgi:hypothetical protein
MKTGFGLPRRDILGGGGDGGQVLVWILTPTGLTTPNSVHIWMDDRIFEDTWIWTEEVMQYKFPLTTHGLTLPGVTYRWDDTKQFKDSLIWTD